MKCGEPKEEENSQQNVTHKIDAVPALAKPPNHGRQMASFLHHHATSRRNRCYINGLCYFTYSHLMKAFWKVPSTAVATRSCPACSEAPQAHLQRTLTSHWITSERSFRVAQTFTRMKSYASQQTITEQRDHTIDPERRSKA